MMPMKERAYLETTFISYLTGRPSRDIIIAAHQQTSRIWWDTRRDRFHLIASQLVLQEARAGDPDAAGDRLKILQQVELIELTDDALRLAKKFLERNAFPLEAGEDALHVAAAATNGANYLLTWNLRHIANAAIRGKIEQVCREEGYEPPVICTPEELLEE
jgi:hypothetical protein